jgi:hypothetical protein
MPCRISRRRLRVRRRSRPIAVPQKRLRCRPPAMVVAHSLVSLREVSATVSRPRVPKSMVTALLPTATTRPSPCASCVTRSPAGIEMLLLEARPILTGWRHPWVPRRALPGRRLAAGLGTIGDSGDTNLLGSSFQVPSPRVSAKETSTTRRARVIATYRAVAPPPVAPWWLRRRWAEILR